MPREENSKVAFESHYGKNSNRTAEKKKQNKKQTDKQTKQTKAQQKRSPIFRKLRVASAFSFETKKLKGNVLVMHTAPFRAE